MKQKSLYLDLFKEFFWELHLPIKKSSFINCSYDQAMKTTQQKLS